nr:transposase [Micromonospora sp. CB01531]
MIAVPYLGAAPRGRPHPCYEHHRPDPTPPPGFLLRTFRDAGRQRSRQTLPPAVLVVDHSHVVQLANRAVTEVRHRTTLTQRGRRGRGADPERRLRNRLTRSRRPHARLPRGSAGRHRAGTPPSRQRTLSAAPFGLTLL